MYSKAFRALMDQKMKDPAGARKEGWGQVESAENAGMDREVKVLSVVRYIHLNPVRASVVELPEKYP